MDGPVGLPLFGHLGDGDLQCAVMRAAQLVSPGTGMRLDCQANPFGMWHQVDQPTTPSNSAEPTCTIVAPSAMAKSKSWLIPIDRSASDTPSGQIGCSWLRSCRSRAKSCRARSRPPSSAAMPISPHRQMRKLAQPGHQALQILRGEPMLGGFRRDIDLQQDRRRLTPLRRRLLERLQQPRAVDRVDQPNQRQRAVDFVALQVAHQVPSQRRARGRRPEQLGLRPQLLRTAFAQVATARPDQCADLLDTYIFGHRDGGDLSRVAPAVPRRLVDHGSDALEVFSDPLVVIGGHGPTPGVVVVPPRRPFAWPAAHPRPN